MNKQVIISNFVTTVAILLTGGIISNFISVEYHVLLGVVLGTQFNRVQKLISAKVVK